MNEPTMTLHEVQRALETQEGELQAAYCALTEQTGDRPLTLPIQALDRLREACTVRSMPPAALKPASGIRC